MLPVSFLILIALAIGAWCVAVFSALSIVALAPKGTKLSAYFALGWWRFDKVRAIAGPKTEAHIDRYRLAFLVFFAVILVAVVATFVMTMPPSP